MFHVKQFTPLLAAVMLTACRGARVSESARYTRSDTLHVFHVEQSHDTIRYFQKDSVYIFQTQDTTIIRHYHTDNTEKVVYINTSDTLSRKQAETAATSTVQVTQDRRGGSFWLVFGLSAAFFTLGGISYHLFRRKWLKKP